MPELSTRLCCKAHWFQNCQKFPILVSTSFSYHNTPFENDNTMVNYFSELRFHFYDKLSHRVFVKPSSINFPRLSEKKKKGTYGTISFKPLSTIFKKTNEKNHCDLNLLSIIHFQSWISATWKRFIGKRGRG